jgi:hypothetical protein
MKTPILRFVATSMAWLAIPAAAQPLLVENGQPRAEIIISDKPQRTVRLAAQELQDYLAKISGARLPIVTEPSGKAVKIFIGASAQSPIKADGLKDGAYRIATGADWMALIGEDTEFTPIEPWAKNNAEIVNGKAQGEWNQITGAIWGLPNLLIYKSRFTLPGDIGRPTSQAAEKAAPLQMWDQDERGSFNAVCGFLMKLGVRWYLPGELGEVLPVLKTIPLPKLDETVRPDFEQRRFSYHGGVHGRNNAMWFMRLGVRDPYGIQDAHGLDTMTNHAEVFAAHPEWFAMYGGKRRFDPKANNHLCYSNEELFQE